MTERDTTNLPDEEPFGNDRAALAVADRVAAPGDVAGGDRTASIDVDEVLREFQPDATRDRFGFDLPVCTLSSHEQIPMPVKPCIVCAGESAVPWYGVESTRFRLVACTECGLGTLHPRPSAREIATFYPPAYYGAAGDKFAPAIERVVRWSAARRMRSLLRGLPPGGRVLDVGCGRGVALRAALDAGFETHGFEISRTAAEGLDPRVHLRIAGSLDEAAYSAERFDLVILWHVLEHLPDPRATLDEVRRILRPGGRLAVAVPNFSSPQARLFGPAWFHLDLPRHLYHFPAAGLRRLVAGCGFDVERVGHSSLRQNPFGWVQSALNAIRPDRRNQLYTALKRQQHGDAPNAGIVQRLAYWMGMPAAVAMSAVAACCRSGATVCITARKRRRA